MTNLILNSFSVIVQAVGLAAMSQVIPPQIMPQEPIAIYKDYLTPEPVLAYSTDLKSSKRLENSYSAQEKEIKEIPEILRKIAYCESGNKQFDEKGNVIRGRENPKDVGIYQINTFYHQETADKLGYDLLTEKGNEAYALWLYEKEGTKPWMASSFCWK